MIILIGGATHTGKTLRAQRLLERHPWPCLSIDHLKMGLIRSGQTDLTPMDDEKLTDYLWPILREMIKTAMENGQNLILEGCYIPSDWYASFSEEERKQIRCRFLVMTEDYIRSHFAEIRRYACVVEQRKDDSGLDMEDLIRDNRMILETCRKEDCLVLDAEYSVDPAAIVN